MGNTPNDRFAEECQTLMEWGRKLSEAGVIKGNQGCLSLLAGSHLLISPASVDYTKDGGPVSVIALNELSQIDGPTPSAEFMLHAEIYRNRKDIRALIHTVQLNTLTASKAGKTIPPYLDDMAQIVGANARVVPFDISFSTNQVQAIIRGLKGRSAVLLKNQGALCGAGNLDDALAVALILEKGCKCAIETSFIGGGKRINYLEANLMRYVYLHKYSRQEEANR